MAEGRLGVATTIVGDVDVYTVTASKTATVNLILSWNDIDATIKVFIRDGSKADEDIIFPSTLMKQSINSRIELTNLVMSAGEILTVESDAIDIICRVHGFEEDEL